MKTSAVMLALVLCVFVFFPGAHADRRVISEYITIFDKSCPDALNDADKKEGIHLSCKNYMQTTNYTCGPAAVMTMMRFYGSLNASEMNQKTELKIASEMNANTDGTTQTDVANWLSAHGYHVTTGSRVTTDLIIENLKKNTLVLVGFNKHWVLSKGFNKGKTADEDEIIFSDSCCGTTRISRATLDSLWEVAQMNHDKCVGSGEFIIASPRN